SLAEGSYASLQIVGAGAPRQDRDGLLAGAHLRDQHVRPLGPRGLARHAVEAESLRVRTIGVVGDDGNAGFDRPIDRLRDRSVDAGYEQRVLFRERGLLDEVSFRGGLERGRGEVLDADLTSRRVSQRARAELRPVISDLE